MKNEVFYIRTTDGQEVETQGITNLPEISVAEDAPEWADDLQFVKLADTASFEATLQISEETMKALDEAMKNIARQITAAMAAVSEIYQAVVDNKLHGPYSSIFIKLIKKTAACNIMDLSHADADSLFYFHIITLYTKMTL